MVLAMKNILLIGAGQLGSRHLQALRSLPEAMKFTIVDPSPQSLKVCEQRYHDKVPGADHQIEFVESLDAVKEREFKLAVVASNSDVRFQILKDSIGRLKIENMLLEKILFNKIEDYEKALHIVKSSGTAAWVNFPMRMQKVYYDLKAELAGQPFTYRVTGSNYGMITNAIHYLDHAVFLNSDPEFVVDTAGLDRKLFESKRRGFFELSGSLTFNFKNQSRLQVECDSEGTSPVLIEIFSNKMRFISKENENKYLICRAPDWKWAEHDLGFLYQSQLTDRFATEILQGREPKLTRFDEACSTHLGMIKPVAALLQTELGYREAAQFPFT
jgi:predicted dehydrogenase